MLKKLTDNDLTPKTEGIHPPVAEVRDATANEKENEWIINELAKTFTDLHVQVLFPEKALKAIFCGKDNPPLDWFNESKKENADVLIRSCCEKLRIYPLLSYTIIKNRKAHTYKPADDYPMFLIDDEGSDFGKTVKHKVIYQPLHPDPQYRYLYDGAAPANFIHGLAQVKTEWKKRENAYAAQIQEAKNNESEAPVPIDPPKKLSEVLIMREASEAFGPALMGYWCCWNNKPADIIEEFHFNELARLTNKVYQVIRNVSADQKVSHETALKHLDLYNLELPKYSQATAFKAATPIADLFDYLTHHNAYDFSQLLKDALPYRFWETEPDYEGPRGQRSRVGWKYVFDNVQAYNFLNKMGFHRMAVEDRKTEYIYVRIDKNIVTERIPVQVKNFMNQFLKERRMDKALRNTLYKSPQLNESSLSNLEEAVIDFKYFDAHSQFLFFKNTTWEITGKGITPHKPGEVESYVWEKDVIPHDVDLVESPFTITPKIDGQGYNIKVNHNRDLFFNYLINTSRIHWRKELEVELLTLPEDEREVYLKDNKFNIAGPLLSLEEREEQQQHLLNKVFALGYLMHRHKSRAKSWAVVAMDNNHNSDGKSYGGTGKSVCFTQALPQVLRSMHQIPGTNPDKTKDPHIFHGLNKYHQATIIDDADKYLNFRFFFEFITGNQVVNPKQSAPFTIPFEELGKLIWLTNFAFLTDSSTKRRILYTVFSDYYHEKTDQDDFKETRKVDTDLGKELFTQFEPEEWSSFFSTMAHCLKFALSCPVKLNPPMDNVDRRNMQREMGVNFEAWAEVYFNPLSGNLDRFLVKDEAYQEFMRDQNMGKGSYTESKFKSSVRNYCVYSDFVFCPDELINDKKNKRIIHQVPDRKIGKDGEWLDGSKKKAKELIYIQTDIEKPLNRILPGEDTLAF